jgi:hypothetical protein
MNVEAWWTEHVETVPAQVLADEQLRSWWEEWARSLRKWQTRRLPGSYDSGDA